MNYNYLESCVLPYLACTNINKELRMDTLMTAISSTVTAQHYKGSMVKQLTIFINYNHNAIKQSMPKQSNIISLDCDYNVAKTSLVKLAAFHN